MLQTRRGAHQQEALPDHQTLQGSVLAGLQARLRLWRSDLPQHLQDEVQELRVELPRATVCAQFLNASRVQLQETHFRGTNAVLHDPGEERPVGRCLSPQLRRRTSWEGVRLRWKYLRERVRNEVAHLRVHYFFTNFSLKLF